MKTMPDITLIASRHSQGATNADTPISGFAALLRKLANRTKAVIAFFVYQASPLNVPEHGFKPENDTLCSAHWNSIYLIRGTKL